MTTPDGIIPSGSGFGEIPTVYQPAPIPTKWTGEWPMPTVSDPPVPRGTSVRPAAPPKGTTETVPLTTEWCDISRSSYLAPGKTRTVTERVTYPEGCTLHFADGQQCLTIRDTSGQTLASFVGVRRYVTNLVDIGEATVTESEGISS